MPKRKAKPFNLFLDGKETECYVHVSDDGKNWTNAVEGETLRKRFIRCAPAPLKEKYKDRLLEQYGQV